MLPKGQIERIGLFIIRILIVSGLLAGSPMVAKADTPNSEMIYPLGYKRISLAIHGILKVRQNVLSIILPHPRY